MTTTITNTIGSAGADYTTPALWEDATDNTSLVAADEIRVGACKNEVFGAVTIGGATTDSTRYRHLTTDTGASFRDNANVQTNALRYNAANGAAISGANNYGGIVLLDEANIHLSNLQIRNTGATGSAILETLGAGTNVFIDNCIIESPTSNSNVINANGGSGAIRNTLVVGRGASMGTLIGGAWNLYNCTIAVPSDKAAASSAVGGTYLGTVKNCAMFGCTAVSGGTGTFITCKTDVASPPAGCTTTTYATGSGAKFQNITDGTHDYRIQAGSSLADVGTTDATNAANDIAGTARPSGSAYDVGAWELVQAGGGGGTTLPQLRSSMRGSMRGMRGRI